MNINDIREQAIKAHCASGDYCGRLDFDALILELTRELAAEKEKTKGLKRCTDHGYGLFQFTGLNYNGNEEDDCLLCIYEEKLAEEKARADRAISELKECYRWSSSDTSNMSDGLMAELAVSAVKTLSNDYNYCCEEVHTEKARADKTEAALLNCQGELRLARGLR